jgi:hypothetical protein
MPYFLHFPFVLNTLAVHAPAETLLILPIMVLYRCLPQKTTAGNCDIPLLHWAGNQSNIWAEQGHNKFMSEEDRQ